MRMNRTQATKLLVDLAADPTVGAWLPEAEAEFSPIRGAVGDAQRTLDTYRIGVLLALVVLAQEQRLAVIEAKIGIIPSA